MTIIAKLKKEQPPFNTACSYKVLLNLASVDVCVTIKMKTTEQYFTVALFTMLSILILTFESVDEILKCDPNESY